MEGTDLIEFHGLATALGRLMAALKQTEEALAAANARIQELETATNTSPQEIVPE